MFLNTDAESMLKDELSENSFDSDKDASLELYRSAMTS